MKKIYESVKENEKVLKEKYNLFESLMIENAASALEIAIDDEVKNILQKKDLDGNKNISVLILTGSGNNGSDGFTLARKIFGKYKTVVYEAVCATSKDCIASRLSASSVGVKIISSSDSKELHELLQTVNIIVDCIYGTGFHGVMKSDIKELLKKCNTSKAFKIACDVPSGLDKRGAVETSLEKKDAVFFSTEDLIQEGFVFFANKTVTMGALKLSLFSDIAKDFVGKIVSAPIGVSEDVFNSASSFENQNEIFLLERSDIKLPIRCFNNVNKGSFGEVAVIAGNKIGASVIASRAAFSFGAGLVCVVEKNLGENKNILPSEIMSDSKIPLKTNAVVIGPGLGVTLEGDLPMQASGFMEWVQNHEGSSAVLDADIFNYKKIDELLRELSLLNRRIVITPHPKEFQRILSACKIGDFSVFEIVQNRIELARAFTKKYQNIVLVLKGANTLICAKEKIFISTEGVPCLAKGGSGDVLAGLIAALLAQAYSALDAACTGVLAHGMASKNVCSSFGMSPFDLIECIKKL